MGKEAGRLSELLDRHERVAIDTPVFIYHFESHPRYRQLTIPLFEAVESGRCQAVVSVLVRLEVLVMPLREKLEDLAESYRFILDTFPNLQQVDIDARVADTAASLRAAYGLSTPDSLHLSGAILSDCSVFITNDGQVSAPGLLEVVTLDSLLGPDAANK